MEFSSFKFRPGLETADKSFSLDRHSDASGDKGRFLVMSFLSVCVLLLTSEAVADPEIRGDADLLDVVVAALETNQEALRQGQCRMHLTYSNGFLSTEADIDLLWNREGAYASYTFSEDELQGDDPTRHGEGRYVIGNGQKISYADSFCDIAPDQRVMLSYHCALPADICFHVSHRPTSPWLRYLRGWAGGEFIEIEQTGDIISLTLKSLEGTGRQHMEFSLAHNCNLIRWELRDANDRVKRSLAQEWREVDGVWYPAVSEHTADNYVIRSARITIESFNPHPSIDSGQFTINALDLPQGTKLEERDAAGQTIADHGYVGARNRSQQADLERIVEEARNNGFANPDREE